MKICKFTLSFLFVFLFSYAGKTQTIDTSTIDGLYSYIFGSLDKTQISSGYLEEYGAPLLTLAPYNGTLSTDNNITMHMWHTLYWQMRSAYVGTGTNDFPAPSTINATIKSFLTNNDATPIVILYGNYNNVKSNAFSGNLLQVVNNQVKDVPGRATTPYQNKKLFAACPASNFTNTGIATFIFKQNLSFSNASVSLNSFYVDFADGNGYRAVGWNTPITASYLDTGMKQIKIKMALNTGGTYECYSNYYVASPVNLSSKYDVTPDLTQFFDATANHSGGTVYVKYSKLGTERKITKPLIVLEGYDINKAAPDILTKPYSYLNLLDAFDNARIEGYDFNTILDAAGYDLIFVQYTDGADDIKRNAAFFQDVITWVNQQKAAAPSTEQNVVIAMSMGGLVARYSLANMTKTLGTSSTQTRLLITHDSPHRGANIPLGLQHLIQMISHAHLFGYDIKDIYPDYDQAIGLLGKTGTQQLLSYTATDETTSISNSFLNTEYRTMITFGSGPQPSYQFVATSLGSECGTPFFPAGQQILNADVDAFLFLAPLLSYRFHTKIEDFALPATGSTSKIARLLLSSKFKLFGLITVAKQVYDKSAFASGTQLPIDGAPGAKYDLQNVDLPPSVTNVPAKNIFFPIPRFLGIIGYVYAYSSGGDLGRFAFVPVASALDISPYNTATISQKFVAGTNPNYPSTSATYIAQQSFTPPGGSATSNNYHIAFTARNSQWMFDRMQGIPDNLNCSGNCSPSYSVSGNDVLCSGSTYTVPGLASNATVTWSATSGVVSINPSTGYATPGSGGSAYITASIASPCTTSPVVVSKQITVGAASNYFIQSITVYPNPPAIDVYTGSSGNSQIVTSWSISVDNGGGTRSDIGYPPAVTTVNGGTNCGLHHVTLTTYNSCGSYTSTSSFTRTTCRIIHLSPNPATGYVIVTDEDTSVTKQLKAGKEKVLITIFDKANRPLKRLSFAPSGQYKFSVAELLPGSYILQLQQGSFVRNLNLIKQ